MRYAQNSGTIDSSQISTGESSVGLSLVLLLDIFWNIFPIFEFGSNSSKIELMARNVREADLSCWKPHSVIFVWLMAGRKCLTFDNTPLFWPFQYCKIWACYTTGMLYTLDCYLSLFNSCCSISLGISVSHIQAIWVIISWEGKAQLDEKSLQRKKLESDNMLPVQEW